MKRVVQHPEASNNGSRYWRSLDELSESPGFKSWMDREFPEGASTLEGVDRRHFLKIMAAGFAFAGVGMAGCRRPESYILTYARQPEQVIPGLPTYYASSFPIRQDAIPLVVETHGARPTKLEGNPSYSLYKGATDLRTQASILDLYDPDRAQRHTGARGETLSTAQVNDLLQLVHDTYAGAGGKGLAILTESSSSPTRLRLMRALRAKYPNLLWAQYDASDYRNPERAVSAVLGRPGRAILKVAKAKRILSLDSDFLFAEPGNLANARGFADGRRIVDPSDALSMNRLYAVESSLTVTGAAADHRLRAATSEIPAYAATLAAKVFELTRASGPVVDAVRRASANSGIGQAAAWIERCAQDLVEHRGASLVVGGAHLPIETHALILAVNEVLGAFGKTLDIVAIDEDTTQPINAIADAIRAGSVRTLIILGGNPAYDAPADLDWASLQARVPQVIRFGYYRDETATVPGTIHIASTHYLESWGDSRTWDGTVLPVQPMILPLFPVMQENEFLARLAGQAAPDTYQLMLETLRTLVSRSDVSLVVSQFLHDGFLENSAYAPINAAWNAASAARVISGGSFAPVLATRSSIEVRFVPDSRVDDGRGANNGWLQECPDPITKLSWDNAILVSPRLAEEIGIFSPSTGNQIVAVTGNNFVRGRQTSPVLRVTVNGRTFEGPAHIQPGMANYTIQVQLGYGRSVTGRVGTGAGFNAFAARTSETLFTATGATIEVTRATRVLANQQEHWSYEGREIFREGNNTTYAESPDFVKEMGIESHAPPNLWNAQPTEEMPLFRKSAISSPRGTGLYETPDFSGPFATQPGTHQWGMSIDLTTCIGCNACVIACQSENNIPIVGREQVIRGREMHWIRLDRYFTSETDDRGRLPEDPQVAIQPMACAHCENAPCESVCPVNATVHDNEGLNVMAYNRCIGTRYCANNCPYKVRRFNFFDYNQRQIDKLYQGPLSQKGTPELIKMVKNPDVTVRMRGVMEKCTYCVQRIQQGKIKVKVKVGTSPEVRVPDGVIKTACEQVCPTDSIVFGDLLDPQSRVSKLKMQERDYAVLGYLNIRPRTTYLGRIRNPNPLMSEVLTALGLPDVTKDSLGRKEYFRNNYPAGFKDRLQSLPTGSNHGEPANS